MANLMVTTLADAAVTGANSAPGTLRQAVYDANQSSDADVIEFAPSLDGDINLSVIGDTLLGPTALIISSPITIRGNVNGIAIARDVSVPELRLFRVTTAGNLTLESISVTRGIARGIAGVNEGENGGNAIGGALYNQGTVQIISSTIHSNRAMGGAAGTGGSEGVGLGGAIYNNEGMVYVRNSTFSDNMATRAVITQFVSCFGGAIYSKNGAVTIHNSTLTNSTARSGRGLYVLALNGTATVDLQSSIFGQSDTLFDMLDCLLAEDVNGQFVVTAANNLVRAHNLNNYAQNAVVSNADPKVGPLADNGGPTMTHALIDESPAIDNGSNSLNLEADQRGGAYLREIGVATDIGAYESQTVVAPPLPGDFNRNNFVDAADFVLWRMTRGTTVLKYSGADGNGNGAVDDADYGIWREHFGEMGPATGAGQALPAEGANAANTFGSTSSSGQFRASADARNTGDVAAPSVIVPEFRSVGQHRPRLSAPRFVDSSPEAANTLLIMLAKLQQRVGPSVSVTPPASAAAHSNELEGVLEAAFGEWHSTFEMD